MAKVTDYMRGADGTLRFAGGDFAKAESTNKHQKTLLLADKGEYARTPTVGVGIETYIDDEGFNDMLSAITGEFMRDGMKVDSVKLGDDGVITTNAAY